jgi:hypothetical protein
MKLFHAGPNVRLTLSAILEPAVLTALPATPNTPLFSIVTGSGFDA